MRIYEIRYREPNKDLEKYIVYTDLTPEELKIDFYEKMNNEGKVVIDVCITELKRCIGSRI